jgi:hypothetical protein
MYGAVLIFAELSSGAKQAHCSDYRIVLKQH